MRSILLALALVLFAQSPVCADTVMDRFLQLAQESGGVKVPPPPKSTANPSASSAPSVGISGPNTCHSTDTCRPPKGGSCECHCEGSKSVCTINYGKNGPPKR